MIAGPVMLAHGENPNTESLLELLHLAPGMVFRHMIALGFSNCLRNVQLLFTSLSPPNIAVAQDFISIHKEVETKHRQE